jgi:spermidine/putrescine transport system substrate-binding protein
MKSVTLALASVGCALNFAVPSFAGDPELTVFDWAGWEIEGLNTSYIEKNGAMPTYSFYADDDEAFQKVSSGFKADTVHPCSQMVPKYRAAGLIEPWDVSKIPEYANIAPRMLASKDFVDDEGVWFLPTDYAYTAILYNSETVPAEDVASLSVFLDPKYKDRISLPDNTDDVWSLALLATGVTDWTTVTDEQFAAAAAWLREAHQNVRAYWSDPSQLSQLIASGEIQVAWSWNDAFALLQSEKFPVSFQRQPTEGVTTWFCGLVNMKDAPGSEEKAYDFANSLLAPSSSQVLLDTFGYAHSNDAAMAKLDPAALEAAGVSPVNTTLLPQVPISTEMRDRMLAEFEDIKAGF